jgi:two-component system, NtrC family, response regulator AtoC
VRVLAATNRDLTLEIEAGRFREDLYYRLNVIAIRIPPLRERREEIPALLDALLAAANAQYDRAVSISPAVRRRLLEHAWPGNIRELQNVVKRLVVLGGDAPLDGLLSAGGAEAPAPRAAVTAETLGLKQIARRAARDAERLAIADTLERTHWNRAKAARLLGISYKALLYKIVDCGLVAKPAAVSAPAETTPA